MALLAVAALVAGCGEPDVVARTTPEPGYETGPDAVPDDIRRAAIAQVEGEYDGKVRDVYELARTSLSAWREAEPSNTSGLTDEDAIVYAIFFTGDFVVHGPVAEPGEPNVTRYHAGRVVLDAGGRQLSVQLWGEPKDPDPPFGPVLDDT